MDKIYFAVSDIHSFYDELMKALKEHGWEDDNPTHILIVCGDLFDRGYKCIELLDFIQKLRKEGRVILIRGNHEDLFLDCVKDAQDGVLMNRIHHMHNGTTSTYMKLAVEHRVPEVIELIESMYDYYELGNYVFVHGGLPIGDCDENWHNARWINGMQQAHEISASDRGKWSNKMVVCGHWHTGWGHYNIFGKGDNEYSLSDIYVNEHDKVIALDACTALSGRVNVLRLDGVGD